MDSSKAKRAGFSTLGRATATRWIWILAVIGIIVGASAALILQQSQTPSGPSVITNPARIESAVPPQTEPVSVVDDKPVLVPPPPEVDPALIDSLLPWDSILAIDEPVFQTAEEASQYLSPDERVIGLVINGDARAYPIPVLSVHEVVNDIVGGESVAITWCPLCYTALVFSRQVNGLTEPVTFGVSGKLLYDTLVMFDRQTESLWSQLYGAAVDGPMAGARLAFFPSVFTEWEAWLQQHPETLVLDKGATCAQFQCGTYSTNPRGSYHVDPYASYYSRPEQGVVNHQIPREAEGNSGGPKKRVLGIRVAGRARAYPYEALRARPVINDEIDGLPVLIWFDPETQTGTAFLRTTGEIVLSFTSDVVNPGIIIDGESGSRWDATSGSAVDGPMKGNQLPSIVTTSAFEIGWYDYFPNSETYRPE
jgi:hypothetical protein